MVNNQTVNARSSSISATTTRVNSHSSNNQMPYNLRRCKEQSKHVSNLLKVKSSNKSSLGPTYSSSSSTSSSQSQSPSPSPSYSTSSSISSNNNASAAANLLKQQQAIIQLCFDENTNSKLNDLFSLEDFIQMNSDNSNLDSNDQTLILNSNTPQISSKTVNKIHNLNLVNKMAKTPTVSKKNSTRDKHFLINKNTTNNSHLINKINSTISCKQNMTQSAHVNTDTSIQTRSKLKRQAAAEEQPESFTQKKDPNLNKNNNSKNHLVNTNTKPSLATPILHKNTSIKSILTKPINSTQQNKCTSLKSDINLKPILCHNNNNHLNSKNNINTNVGNIKNVKKNKRVSIINKFKSNELNFDDASDYSDNDDTSESENSDQEDENKTLMVNNTIMTNGPTINSNAKKIVSFATNTTISTNINNNNKNVVVSKDDYNKSGRTPPHRKFRKLRLFDTAYTPKTLIKKAADASVSSKKTNVTVPTSVIKKIQTETKTIQITSNCLKKNENLETSPPHDQLLRSSKLFSNIENVHQTPKSLRRTPNKIVLANSALRLNQPLSLSPTSNQDIEMQEAYDYSSSRSSSSMSNKITTNTTTKLRLLEQTKTNKSLNFDDSEDDTQTGKNEDKKIEYSISLQHKYLSHQSLFRPINKPNNFETSFRLNNSNSLQSISTFNSNHDNHSPFLLNQQQYLQANINPFTPTNSYDNNSKLTSASNAAQMAKFYTTSNTPKDLKASSSLLKTTFSSSLQQLPTKRCYDLSSSTSASNQNLKENNHNINENDLNNSYNSINKMNEDHNSLPRNKRLALRQCLVSRYHEEFHEVCKLGSGEFGDVFKCINRLDGCTYAIKRSKKPILGGSLEVAAWKEVCAHAALGQHNHIVQYYSAWAECDRMLIQNEYCNGGSLAEFIESLKHSSNSNVDEIMMLGNYDGLESFNNNSNNNIVKMKETDLKILLLHIAKGLSYMHSKNLAHLDIKPGNIFICRSPRRHNLNLDFGIKLTNIVKNKTTIVNGVVINEESGIESEEIDDDEPIIMCKDVEDQSLFSEIITYKIGDLGHVTSTVEPHVEEGDCRYLPNEILQEQYDQLAKADIFALALTVYVCGSLEELPKNGEEWHWIRKGNLKDLPQCSDRFKKLLSQMINESPAIRPSAPTLIHHPCICPDATKSKTQLRIELNQEKFKNEILKRKVKKYEQQMSCQKLDSPIFSLSKNMNISKSIDLTNKSNKFLRSLSSTNI